jgi:hypothetical protein
MSHRSPDHQIIKSPDFHVAVLYTALTIVLTWPLARGVARDLPGDFGDPLFVTWVLGWDATHLGRGLWNANIFYPHPLALAYSEHFLPQAITILPVYALTRNPVLCYNLVFLSTFVLSGAGMFLLVRELTNSRSAGVVAGLAFMCAPYRFANLPHLQVLSSGWMPLVIFGLRRYFAVRPAHAAAMRLAGAGAAWLLQNLSCGYYLFFFSPLVIAYTVWELTTRRLWTDARTLWQLAALVAAVAAATAPFLIPYLQLRQLGAAPRSLSETIRFSADTHAYFTAAPELWFAGPLMQAWPQAEGLLFPGFTITALASAAVVMSGPGGAALRTWERIGAWTSGGVCIMAVALAAGWTVRLPGLKITSLARVGWTGAALAGTLLVLSPRIRSRAGRWLATPAGFFAVATLFAIVLSFGPQIHARGRVVSGTNLYALFYDYVPGFDGLRVAARFGMVVAFGLAVLAGFAAARAARLDRWRPVVWVAGALIALEGCSIPLTINYTWPDYRQPGLAPLPQQLDTDASRLLYAAVGRLPARAAIVELPLGEAAFDIRYMYYSTRHWRLLVNGYSGGQPPEYHVLTESLQDIDTRPEYAWQALRHTAATHTIVHEAFYAGTRGAAISTWLRANGAREIESIGTDRIFELPVSSMR